MSFRHEFRNPGRLAWVLCVLLAACGARLPSPPRRSTPEPEETTAQAPEAPALSVIAAKAAEDPAAALNDLDRWQEHYAQDPDYWRLYANSTQSLFDAEMAGGRLSPGLASDLLADLERAWVRVHELDSQDADALLELARTRTAAGSPAAAWDAAAKVFPLLGEELHGARVAAAEYGVRLVAAAITAGARSRPPRG